MIKSKISLLALALAAISTQAFADTSTKIFQSTATLSSSCVISATNVNFGTITPAKTGNATANGTITATCSNKTPYSIFISSYGWFRHMDGTAGNPDKLAYNLYLDAAGINFWAPDSNVGTDRYARGTGTGAAQSYTVYGFSPLNQYLKPDNYAANLTVYIVY